MTSGKKLQSISLILALVGGLLILLGAVVVGLWLTQEQTDGSLVSGQPAESIQPWRLKEAQQMQFILLLAQDYALDGDAARAREAVAGWDIEKLSQLLGTIEFQITDTQTLKQIIALRQALGVPSSMFAAPSLLQQDSILWSAGLALLFLLGASAVAFWPNKKAEEASDAVASRADEAQAEGTEEDADQAQEQAAAERVAGAAEEGNAEGAAQQEEQGNQGAGGGGPAPKQEEQGLAQLTAAEPGEVSGLFSSLFADEDEDTEDLSLLARGLENLDIGAVAAKTQEILDQLYELTQRERSR